MDILEDGRWSNLKDRLRAGEFDCLIITPPCNTHSRARHCGNGGPPPVRSRRFPSGMPWLFGRLKRQVETANTFIQIMKEGFKIIHASKGLYLGEHPEDLGMAASGEVPASIWQDEEVRSLPDATSGAFFQCPFGAATSKPTRIVTNMDIRCPVSFEEGEEAFFFKGWPLLDKKFRYIGPLPHRCGHTHPPLLGRNKDGSFRTTAAAAYPGKMCYWLASNIFENISRRRAAAALLDLIPKGGVLVDQDPPPGTSFTEAEGSRPVFPPLAPGALEPIPLRPPPPPPVRKSQSGKGTLKTNWAGKEKDFHDGLNLNSSGRFHPEDRAAGVWGELGRLKLEWMNILRLEHPKLDVLCYKLATGKFQDSPFSAPMLERARTVWVDILSLHSSLPKERLAKVPEHQPFLLFALGETLRLLEDGDHKILFEEKDSFATGVPVGYKDDIPLVPGIYEPKEKWRKYDESTEVEAKENYSSATEEILQAQFKEEEELGQLKCN